MLSDREAMVVADKVVGGDWMANLEIWLAIKIQLLKYSNLCFNYCLKFNVIN
jgi:hypothetical protein